ncbi:MAG: phosphoribosylanthranilate isomerase [Ruminiclostridium sp.]|nr:phosphoribosylanthranilate isomerase [Ruminiclostridium sp.]
MTQVKICGIKNQEGIEIVNRHRPDYIGFVFAESRRRVTHEQAYELRRKLAEGIKTVGVFVNDKVDSILKLALSGIIDVIQLHGDEDEHTIELLKQKTVCPIIKAVRVEKPEQILAAQMLPCDMLLLDAFHQGSYGGIGRQFDHSLIPPLQKPFFLAGGLDEENVGQCILKYKPYGVDISSGAETNGNKDEAKIRKILKAVSLAR